MQMFYLPGPLPGPNGSSYPETQGKIFVHHQKIIQVFLKHFFDRYKRLDHMISCKPAPSFQSSTLTWGMSTLTRASNIGCLKRRSGAYYCGSHYSNREQRNKHRWESLLGQALSDIICDRRSAVDAWVESCPSLSIFKHYDSNQTCLGSIWDIYLVYKKNKATGERRSTLQLGVLKCACVQISQESL